MSTDPALNTLLAAVRVVLLTIGGAAVGDGLITSGLWAQIQVYIGFGAVVITGVWTLYSAWMNFRRARAQAVTAGIRLATSGKALDHEGNVISQFSAAAETAPKDATMASADAIVKEFGPSASSVAKA